MTCPHCGEDAKFNEYRPKSFTSLLGDIRFARAYYHCSHCHKGCFPTDKMLRLFKHRQTPGAREAIALAGIQDSFGKVADRLLYKLTGIRTYESTVERTTEAAGEQLGKLLAAGTVFTKPTKPTPTEPIPTEAIPTTPDDATTADATLASTARAPQIPSKKPWTWHRDATGKTCGYVSLDATGIMMQGPNGAKAEGRMVYLAMVYNPRPRQDDNNTKPCEDVRYLAGLTTLNDLGEQLRRGKRVKSG